MSRSSREQMLVFLGWRRLLDRGGFALVAADAAAFQVEAVPK